MIVVISFSIVLFQDLETNTIGSKDEEEDEVALIDMFMELARRDEV